MKKHTNRAVYTQQGWISRPNYTEYTSKDIWTLVGFVMVLTVGGTYGIIKLYFLVELLLLAGAK